MLSGVGLPLSLLAVSGETLGCPFLEQPVLDCSYAPAGQICGMLHAKKHDVSEQSRRVAGRTARPAEEPLLMLQSIALMLGI